LNRIIIYGLTTALLMTLILGIPRVGYAQHKTAKKTTKSHPPKVKKTIYGQASYYSQKFHGRKTASGTRFDHSKYTAACNVLPFGTRVRVTNLKNNRTVIVTITDRLHHKTRRLIDLTRAAASKLGFIKSGLARVKIEVLN